jgi:hypothetical protein
MPLRTFENPDFVTQPAWAGPAVSNVAATVKAKTADVKLLIFIVTP